MRPEWRMENSTMIESGEPFQRGTPSQALEELCTLPFLSPPLPSLPRPLPLLHRFHKGQHITLESVEHGQECGVITTISLNEVRTYLLQPPALYVCACVCVYAPAGVPGAPHS